MSEKYNFKTSEKKWQTYWDDQNIFKKIKDKKKYYILEMFPSSGKYTWDMFAIIL